jgi:hypothetical protein
LEDNSRRSLLSWRSAKAPSPPPAGKIGRGGPSGAGLLTSATVGLSDFYFFHLAGDVPNAVGLLNPSPVLEVHERRAVNPRAPGGWQALPEPARIFPFSARLSAFKILPVAWRPAEIQKSAGIRRLRKRLEDFAPGLKSRRQTVEFAMGSIWAPTSFCELESGSC